MPPCCRRTSHQPHEEGKACCPAPLIVRPLALAACRADTPSGAGRHQLLSPRGAGAAGTMARALGIPAAPSMLRSCKSKLSVPAARSTRFPGQWQSAHCVDLLATCWRRLPAVLPGCTASIRSALQLLFGASCWKLPGTTPTPISRAAAASLPASTSRAAAAPLHASTLCWPACSAYAVGWRQPSVPRSSSSSGSSSSRRASHAQRRKHTRKQREQRRDAGKRQLSECFSLERQLSLRRPGSPRRASRRRGPPSWPCAAS